MGRSNRVNRGNLETLSRARGAQAFEPKRRRPRKVGTSSASPLDRREDAPASQASRALYGLPVPPARRQATLAEALVTTAVLTGVAGRALLQTSGPAAIPPATVSQSATAEAPATHHAPAVASPPATTADGGKPWDGYNPYDADYDRLITFSQLPVSSSAFANATQGLQLSVNERFDALTALDPARWAVGNDAFHGGNNELQDYLPRQVTLVPGEGLQLLAERAANGTYASGKIYAKADDLALASGAIEFVAKVPRGAGLWPAFWLLPKGLNSAAGDDPQWPTNGEIDNEVEGGYTTGMHGTLHVGSAPNQDTAIGGVFDQGTDYADGEFHRFQTAWDDKSMRWYVDGVLYKNVVYAEQAGALPEQLKQAFASGVKFAPIVNLAVGGAFDAHAKTDAQIQQAGTRFPAAVLLQSISIWRAGQ